MIFGELEFLCAEMYCRGREEEEVVLLSTVTLITTPRNVMTSCEQSGTYL
jgi:hypothetical protein